MNDKIKPIHKEEDILLEIIEGRAPSQASPEAGRLRADLRTLGRMARHHCPSPRRRVVFDADRSAGWIGNFARGFWRPAMALGAVAVALVAVFFASPPGTVLNQPMKVASQPNTQAPAGQPVMLAKAAPASQPVTATRGLSTSQPVTAAKKAPASPAMMVAKAAPADSERTAPAKARRMERDKAAQVAWMGPEMREDARLLDEIDELEEDALPVFLSAIQSEEEPMVGDDYLDFLVPEETNDKEAARWIEKVV